MIKLLVKDLVSIYNNSIIDGVDGGVSKIVKAKFKNMIMLDIFTKFKLLIKSSSRSSFLTSRTRLAFCQVY